MIEIDCKEIPDQILVLVTYLGDRNEGEVVPLVKNDVIVLDTVVFLMFLCQLTGRLVSNYNTGTGSISVFMPDARRMDRLPRTAGNLPRLRLETHLTKRQGAPCPRRVSVGLAQ